MSESNRRFELFAVSMFDTDYLLVSEKKLDAAIAALQVAGHRVSICSAIS
jgi:hypothetical protein